jgi:hypothetical protein
MSLRTDDTVNLIESVEVDIEMKLGEYKSKMHFNLAMLLS